MPRILELLASVDFDCNRFFLYHNIIILEESCVYAVLCTHMHREHVHIYIYIYIYTCIHTYIHINTDISMHTQTTRACTHTHTKCVYTHSCIRTHT